MAPVNEIVAKNKENLNNQKSVLQIIAFTDESEALAAQEKLSKAIGLPVVIDFEDGLYKLRINGISGKEEADILISKLEQAGYSGAYLRNPGEIDSRDNSFDEKQYSAVIQVGAFIGHENALDVEQKLHRITDLPINVIFEGGYYKVHISGFPGRVQALAFLPKLLNKGYSEAFVVRVIRQ